MPAKEKDVRISFYEQIQRNKVKSALLMAIVFIVLVLLGYVISLVFEPGYFFFIMIISIIFSMSYIIFGYYNSDKIALASVGAKKASPSEHRQLFNSIEGLTIASGMPMPQVYIMESGQINAFATGRSPAKSVICVTTGALQKLSKHELEGVLGHELSHIANYDIRFMTLAAVLIGMVAIISQLFLRSLWYGGYDMGGGRGRNEGRGNAILMLIAIALAILAPIMTQLVQFAISRKREYAADASSVKFTRTPTGLINALKKIKMENTPETNRKISRAVAPLFISDPFSKKFQELFSTHPPVEKRIGILERM